MLGSDRLVLSDEIENNGSSTKRDTVLLDETGLEFHDGITGVLKSAYPADGTQKFYGTWTDGCVRFTQSKIQIAWKYNEWVGAVDNAWGNGLYESNAGANGIELGNWHKAFSNHPFISHYANTSAGNTGIVANGPVNPSATSAGSVLIERGTTLASTRWYIYTFAVGTYT